MTTDHPDRTDRADGATSVRARASWHLRANAVVVGWLALTVAAVLAQRALPTPRWLAIHVFLLGAVTNAILIWSEHFSVALLRVRTPAPQRAQIRLGALNGAVVALLYGVAAGHGWLAVGAAGVVVAVVAWHTLALARMTRHALPSRFGHLAGWYVAAGAMLVTGGTLGGLMVSGRVPGVWNERIHAAHVEVNLFGWVGLTVLGTLFPLWPTILRTQVPQRVGGRSRWALRLAVPGLALTVTGLLLAVRPVAAGGLALYAAAAALVLLPVVEAARQRRPHTPAAWTVAAAVCWFEVAVGADMVIVALHPAAAEAFDPLLPLVLLGFVGQVLLGALTHLLPVVLGGGPARLKHNAATMHRGWLPRLVAVNVAVPLLALPVPHAAGLAGWALALGALGSFILLAVVALVGRHTARRRRPSPALAGVVAGCLLTAAAAAVASNGSSTSGDRVTVRSGQQTVDVTLAGMRIRPATIEVTPGTSLVLRVVNRDAQRHDLRLATGEHTPLLDPNEGATLRIGPLRTSVDGWCTVAGHRAAGMTMRIAVVERGVSGHGNGPGTGTDAGTDHGSGSGSGDRPPLDFAAPMDPGWKPYDAALRPAPGGREHRVEIHATDAEVEVAPGVRQPMWTFGGTVPGPVLRGRVGDVFTITFVNDATTGHGIDFHAGALAPDRPMRTIAPGERLTYRFRADHAGAWLYHCSAMPMLQHIGNGMYGAVVIDPPDLPPVDREYVLVHSELYLGQPGSADQVAKLRGGRPDAWMFNGTAAGYDHAPLAARAGERVRVWVVAAGPGSGVAFHVVGAQFDTVYKEGGYLLSRGGPGAAQVLDLAPAQGGFVETVFPEPGHYPFVDHDTRHADAGAHGVFEVTG